MTCCIMYLLVSHQAPIDSSKPMVAQMARVNLSVTLNKTTKCHECGKDICREEVGDDKDGRERKKDGGE